MLKISTLFLTLLIPTFALAEVEPISTPSPNVGTITPTAIVAETGSFSGSVTASSVTSQSGFTMSAGQALIGATVAQAGSDIRIIAARNTSGNHTYIRSDAAAASQSAFEWSKDGTLKWAAIVEGGSDKLGYYDGSAYAFVLSPVSGGGSSFVSGVTASSVTALSGGMKLSTIGDKVTFDNARRWIKIDSAGVNPMTFSQHVGAGSGFLFGLDNDDAGADSLTTLVNITPTGTGIGTASPCSTCTLHVAGGASVTGNLSVDARLGVGGVPGGAGVPLRVEGVAQFNEAGDANNFLQMQASGDIIYYDSWGTAANSGGHRFRVSDASKIALDLDATGGAALYSRTKAQLLTITAPIGALYYCSDCSDPTSGKPTVVISTGASAGNFGTLPIGVFQ